MDSGIYLSSPDDDNARVGIRLKRHTARPCMVERNGCRHATMDFGREPREFCRDRSTHASGGWSGHEHQPFAWAKRQLLR